MKKILITGSTGMIGSLVLDFALKHDLVGSVVSIVRKRTTRVHHKLTEIVIPDILRYNGNVGFMEDLDAICFCIGTYTGSLSPDKFRAVNVDLPLEYGRLMMEHSPKATYCLLSGQGADQSEKSRIQFARDKGAAENGLLKLGIKSFYTFRPGYIYPVTKRIEPNLTYKISRFFYPFLKHLGEGMSIKSTELASSMLKVALAGAESSVLENKDIKKYI